MANRLSIGVILRMLRGRVIGLRLEISVCRPTEIAAEDGGGHGEG